MPNEPIETDFPYDFFVSRRGIAANVAIEVAEVLESAGHKVLVQDFDIPFSANFVAAMHDAVKSARHFIGLLTEDYDVSPFTREEWTAFFAASRPTGGRRRLVILRVEDVAPPGLLASIVYGDLVNVTNWERRRDIILASAEGRSSGKRRGNQVFHGVPPRNPDFTGRADMLAKLHEMLDTTGKPAAITQAAQTAIHGLGGVGKTSLAIEYAHLHVEDYAGIWWAAAENRTVLMTSLAALAGVLDARLANEPNTEKAAHAALATLTNHERPWLLIYDNASEPAEIKDLRPSKGAKLLITTRHPDWGGQASELEVDVLERQESIDFLLKRTDQTDHEEAAALAETLGDLPLALDHAGAYVVSAAITFMEYARRYQELIAKAPKGSVSTVATFDLAIERAQELNQEVEKLLGFFSVMAPERIPLELVNYSIISDRQRDDAMSALFSVSLIRRDNAPNGEMAVSIHRLVRAAMRSRIVSTRRLAQTLTSATARVVAKFPRADQSNDPKTWPIAERLLPHALALGRDPENRSKFSVQLLQDASTFLCERGAFNQSEQICREAMTLAETLYGRTHPLYAITHLTMIHTLTFLGKLVEAENLCREAIRIYTRKKSQGDEALASMLNALGILLSKMNRYAEAEKHFHKAVFIIRRAKGINRHRMSSTLSNLANTLRNLGQSSDSERFIREAISIEEKAFGRESHFALHTRNNLADLLRTMGRHEEAEQEAREAVSGLGKLYGTEHYTYANSVVTLALILIDTSRTLDVEISLRHSIEILIKSLGPEHSDVGFVRAALARLLVVEGRTAEASDQALWSLAIHTKAMEAGFLWEKRYAIELSGVLEMVGRTNEAASIRSRYGD